MKLTGVVLHGFYPQSAWRYVQALAVSGTAIVLSPSTLEAYSEISLLPTSLIGDLKEAEQIVASLPCVDGNFFR